MVTVDVTRRDDWIVDLDISVDREQIEDELEAAVKELNRTIRLPGFRQGRIPRSILEERMGQDLQKKAIAKLLPKAYAEAIGQAKIVPIIPPKIEDIDYKKDEHLRFRAQVEVKPEITVEDYKGIPLEKRIKKVTEEAVEEELRSLQIRNATLLGIDDRPTKDGDIITIDYEGFVDGTPIPGAKGENLSIEIGRTRLLPGVEDELIGVEANTTKEIETRLPDDYKAKEFAGRPAIFRVNIKSIKERRLPPIDDEFARDLGRSDLNELREAIKTKLEGIRKDQAWVELKNRLIKILISKSNFSVPRGLLEREVDQMVEEFGKNLAPLRLTIEGYLKERNLTLENLRDDFRARAIEELKGGFIIEAIADREGIEVSEEELQEEIDRVARSLATTPEEMRRLIEKRDELDTLRARVRMDKTLDLILEAAEIKEVYE